MKKNNTQIVGTTASTIPIMMSFKRFDHLMLNFYAVNTIFMPIICIKFQIASQAVCAYAHYFRKRPRCALIGACALIRTNTVVIFSCILHAYIKDH